MRVGKLKNGKASSKDEITLEIKKKGGGNSGRLDLEAI